MFLNTTIYLFKLLFCLCDHLIYLVSTLAQLYFTTTSAAAVAAAAAAAQSVARAVCLSYIHLSGATIRLSSDTPLTHLTMNLYLYLSLSNR